MDEFATRMGLQFEFAEQTRAEPLGNMGIWNCSGRRGTDDKTLMTISSSLPHRLIGVAKEKKKNPYRCRTNFLPRRRVFARPVRGNKFATVRVDVPFRLLVPAYPHADFRKALRHPGSQRPASRHSGPRGSECESVLAAAPSSLYQRRRLSGKISAHRRVEVVALVMSSVAAKTHVVIWRMDEGVCRSGFLGFSGADAPEAAAHAIGGAPKTQCQLTAAVRSGHLSTVKPQGWQKPYSLAVGCI